MKVLFIYPNHYLHIGIPTGIASLSAVLKREGHKVDIFDWTFIKTEDKKDEHRTANKGLYVPTPYTIEDLVTDDPVQSLDDALADKLKVFDPDLVAVSVMTGYFDNAVELLKSVRPSCMVVVGGVHSSICPEDSLAPEVVDCICIGEGEEFFLELCDHLERDKDYTNIRNLGYKNGKDVRFNDLRPFVDLDALPDPDWDLFDERHLFRPFMGEVYKGSWFSMSRGCPDRCSYCVNMALRANLKGCGHYFRYQSPATTARQIVNLKEKHRATWFRFADDSIMLFKERYLEELGDALRPLGIMFGCSVRPNTVNERKVALLKSMGCVAASIGIESGNSRIRKEILNRNISDEQIMKAIHLLNEAGIRVSTFNMIGLPGETRENVFETIRLNKKLNVQAINAYVVYPYPGTEISRKYHAHFRDEKGRFIPVSEAAGFELSKMSRGEVQGLLRTFELYVILPEEMWYKVRDAEGDSPEASALRDRLNEYAIELQQM